MLISLVFIYYFFFKSETNYNNKETTFLILGIISLAISWSFITYKQKIKESLISLIIGPYLLASFVLQSGLFTDRSRDLREAMENIPKTDLIKNQIIKVDKSGMNNSEAVSKIIRISLMTPNLGKSIEKINDLNSSELAWSTNTDVKNNANISYEIIYEHENISPWKLIKRN